MEDDDIKTIASLVDWSKYDKIMGRVFYDTFGKLLEEKVSRVQTYKSEIRDYANQNCGGNKLPSTPKRFNAMASLLDSIQKMKTICFESDDEDAENSQRAIEANGDVGTGKAVQQNTPVNSKAATSKNHQKHSARQKKITQSEKAKKSNQVKTPLQTKAKDAKVKQPAHTVTKTGTNINAKSVFSVPVKKIASPKLAHPSSTLRQSARIKEIHEKADKQRDDWLKEKAERAKRDLEDRFRRVGCNNRAIEAENREREEKLRSRTNSNSRNIQTPKNLRASVLKSALKPARPAQPVLTSRPPLTDSAGARKLLPIRETRFIKPMYRANNANQDSEDEIVDETPNATHKAKHFNATVVEATPENATFTPSAREKEFIPSTKDNYFVDDLDSDDSTDDEHNPRKIIPIWARPAALKNQIMAVNTRVTMEQKERYFGPIADPIIEQIFGELDKKKKRGSSAEWESPLTNPRAAESRFRK
ncbi:inner centromere protein, ARK binding region domain-containing protein [Ditylenchus destructor]|uniref:Inner centromere protein, ARK binding region domain-containing protein n=1 Tax=Ditylenchus destructor TaxID=166010 RepID=A0AAD4R341_9BILA|nr:inner centromere protein, ARK binding region domain-containing protein [Ditylenchus destructor]